MKTKTSDHSVFCYVHSAGGETELRPWPEDYSSYALTAKTARRQGGLNIRKYAKILPFPGNPKLFLSKRCLGGRGWKR